MLLVIRVTTLGTTGLALNIIILYFKYLGLIRLFYFIFKYSKQEQKFGSRSNKDVTRKKKCFSARYALLTREEKIVTSELVI